MRGIFGVGLTTVALAFLVLAGCGTTEEEKKVDLGHGVVVEVPANLKGKALVVEAIRAAYADQLDFTPELEDCNLKWLQQVPQAAFNRVLERPKDEQVQAGLAFANQHTPDCIQSGDNIVESDANESTLRLARGLLVATVTRLLEKHPTGVTEREKSCFIAKYQNLSDSELIQLVNSTFDQQRQFGAEAARNCVSP